MGSIDITAVSTPAELDRFIHLPARINAADPNYVVQLTMERREALSPKKNPYFEHAEAQFWLARRGGEDVGRISAQIDRLVAADIGHFGMVCAIDDAAVFAALFEAAEAWLTARGRTRILGPFNLSINEETGLLVEGFDTPPMLLMGHDARYVAGRIEALGYAKAMDVIAYLFDVNNPFPRAAQRLLAKPLPPGMTVRKLDTQRYREEFDTVTAIFNDAWAGNWGFIPFTEAEIAHMAKAMKPVIKADWVSIVELDGEAIGFGITLPNVNELIADFGGSLLPFNWAKLLLRLKRGARTARVPLMGIRRKYHGSLIGAAAMFHIVDRMRAAVRDDGVGQVELSWILENNTPMRNVIAAVGGKPYKTYRVYEKALAATGAARPAGVA